MLLFPKSSLIAPAKRHFKPTGFLVWDRRGPSGLSCGSEGCGESLTHLYLGTASSTVLRFHLTFQKQDGGRKGGRFVLHNN